MTSNLANLYQRNHAPRVQDVGEVLDNIFHHGNVEAIEDAVAFLRAMPLGRTMRPQAISYGPEDPLGDIINRVKSGDGQAAKDLALVLGDIIRQFPTQEALRSGIHPDEDNSVSDDRRLKIAASALLHPQELQVLRKNAAVSIR